MPSPLPDFLTASPVTPPDFLVAKAKVAKPPAGPPPGFRVGKGGVCSVSCARQKPRAAVSAGTGEYHTEEEEAAWSTDEQAASSTDQQAAWSTEERLALLVLQARQVLLALTARHYQYHECY